MLIGTNTGTGTGAGTVAGTNGHGAQVKHIPDAEASAPALDHLGLEVKVEPVICHVVHPDDYADGFFDSIL